MSKLITGFGITCVLSPLPCEYPDTSLLKSTFPRQGSDLTFCGSASPRGSRRGRGIPMSLYMLRYLLECSSPSCPLICPLVITNTTLIFKKNSYGYLVSGTSLRAFFFFLNLIYVCHNPMSSISYSSCGKSGSWRG